MTDIMKNETDFDCGVMDLMTSLIHWGITVKYLSFPRKSGCDPQNNLGGGGELLGGGGRGWTNKPKTSAKSTVGMLCSLSSLRGIRRVLSWRSSTTFWSLLWGAPVLSYRHSSKHPAAQQGFILPWSSCLAGVLKIKWSDFFLIFF